MLVMFISKAAVEKAAIFKVGTGQKYWGEGVGRALRGLGHPFFSPRQEVGHPVCFVF